jgi:hypothetical protein
VNHVSQVKVALKAYLTAYLPDKLREADAAAEPWASGDQEIRTPPPAIIHRTDKGDLEDYPAIELIALSARPVVDSFAEVYRHRLVIGFTLTGDDEQTLTTWTERYMWAIRRLMRDLVLDPPIGTGPIETGEEQYSLVTHVPKGLETPFVKGGFIEIFAKTLE